MAYYHRSDLRYASPSAFESGIFCLLFFAAEKKEVAEGRTKIKKVELSPTLLTSNANLLELSNIKMYGRHWSKKESSWHWLFDLIGWIAAKNMPQ